MAFKFGKTPQNSLMSKLYPNGQSVPGIPQLPGVSAQVPAQTTAIQSQIKPLSFGATTANINRTNLPSQNTTPAPAQTNLNTIPAPQAQPQNANTQLEAIKSALGGISTGLQGLQVPKEAPKPDALTGIEAELAKSQTPSQEEQDTQKTLSNLLASRELGLAAVQNKPIAMPFITGQQAAIQRTAAVQAMPLQAQLAALQGRRQAALDVAKSKLDVEKTRRAEIKPQQDKGFTLSPGQIRYDEQGRPIASGGVAPKSEAQQLKEQEQSQAKDLARSEVLGNINLVNDILNGSPESITGVGQFFPSLTNAATLNKYNQLKAKLSLANRQQLKGSGAISDFESRTLDAAASALGRNLNNEDFKRELARIKGVFQTAAGLPATVVITDPSTGQSQTVQAGRAGIDQAIADGMRVEYQ